MSGRRWATRRAAIAAGLLGSAAVLVFTRRADDPAAFALALASLAGVALLLIVGRRLRPILAVLLIGLGAGLTGAGMSGWGLLQVAAGVLIVMAGVVTLVGGGTWGEQGARYETRQPGSEHVGSTPGDAWRALDAGVDPTLDDPA